MIGHALVLGTLPSDAMFVLNQDAVGSEVELVPDGLEGHSDVLILQQEPGTILPEFALGLICGDGFGVVEVHVGRRLATALDQVTNIESPFKDAND